MEAPVPRPDRLPPQLDGLVALDDQGAVDFFRLERQPLISRPALAIVGALPPVLALLLRYEDVASQFICVAMALGIGGLCAGVLAAGRRSIRQAMTVGPGGLTLSGGWLELTGEPNRGRAALFHVNRGERLLVRSWVALPPSRQRGWDAPSVRWFARQVARASGLQLRDELPAFAGPHPRELTDLLWLHDSEPQWPDEQLTEDGFLITVPGSAPAFTGWTSTSFEPAHALRIDPTHLQIRDRRVPIGSIQGITAWFGERSTPQGPAPYGQVRAQVDGDTWVMVEREIDEGEDGGVIVGAALGIERALAVMAPSAGTAPAEDGAEDGD